MNRPHHWRSAAALIALIAVSFAGSRASGQIVPQQICVGSVSANSLGPPVPFPDAASHGFEESRIDGNPSTYVYIGQLPPPYDQWEQWLMSGTSGIALNGSPITALNPNAPEGTHVGFLEGLSDMSASVAFAAGTGRIRLRGAQQLEAGGPDQQVVRVSIGGVIVAEVEFEDGDWQEVVSRPFTSTAAATLPVVIEGLVSGETALIDEVLWEPIGEWNDPATWGGCVPASLADVTIPVDVAVAVVGTCAARTTIVEGELLAGNVDSTLTTRWLMVSGEDALFQVGTVDLPFQEEFTLTLNAAPTDPPAPMGGKKGLTANDGGTIDLHGQPRLSWTKLDASALVDDTSITTVDAVDWEEGDLFVIASSLHQQSTNPGFPNYIDQAEVKQVDSVAGHVITLDTSNYGDIDYYHHGAAPQMLMSPDGQSWSLDQRAEVGLLTHNVKVQGDANSEPTKFGGHIMIMRGPNDVGGAAFISNVELYRMGQRQQLGRYPMHWHVMVDQAGGQYFTDCSVHRTYNRAITIHGTDSVDVSRNVAYDNEGHAVFLEDGSEQYNTITNNLVLTTRKPEYGDEMLPSDNEFEQLQNRSPASFWITNPMNTITGNVAAGTEGTGFWFILPEEILGLSASEPYFQNPLRIPNETPLGEFADNVAHSCGSGFDVNDGIWIGAEPAHLDHSVKTNIPWNPGGITTLERMTIYGCDMGLYAGIGNDQIHFEEFVIADNNQNVRLAAYHTVKNSALLSQSGNVVWGGGVRFGYVVYDGAGRMRDCYLEGFDAGGTTAIFGAGGATLHPNHLFSGMNFSHVSLPKVSFGNYAASVTAGGVPVNPDYFDPQNPANPRNWGQALRDEDGTLWGAMGMTVIGNHPFMHIAAADITPPGITTHAKLSPFRFGHLRIVHPGINPGSLPDVFVTREPNGSYPGFMYENRFQTDKHKQQPVIVEGGFQYTVEWTLPLQMSSIAVTLDDVENQDTLYLTLKDIGGQPNLAVGNATQVFSGLALRNATVTSYLIAGSDVVIKYADVPKEHTVTLSW